MEAIGQIFSSTEADNLFGYINASVQIETAILSNFCSISSGKLMFKVKNNYPVILDNKRQVLFPEGEIISPDEVFIMFTTNKVEELISEGKAATTQLQQREEVLSIQNGNFVLEIGLPCPPYC
ncbi:MAG: hypothetical protein GYA60_10550 [Candidatus Methanofastidiosa archaeon]|nr:hypothetical protein [Candidatus Methanofastidiosa archaeon]